MLSARSDAALAELARSHAALLAGDQPVDAYALACNAARHRQQHACRLVVWGERREDLLAGDAR